MTSKVFCECCLSTVSKSYWLKHIYTNKHNKNERNNMNRLRNMRNIKNEIIFISRKGVKKGGKFNIINPNDVVVIVKNYRTKCIKSNIVSKNFLKYKKSVKEYFN